MTTLASKGPLRLATRGSTLALWQANRVSDKIRSQFPELQIELVVVTTKPDRAPEQPLHALGGDKGLFVKEVEDAIRDGRAHAGVHSLKDVPTLMPDDMALVAYPERADVRDVLVGAPGASIESLAAGALVGTSALRRRGQLLRLRPDLRVQEVRGNVDTRVRKVREKQYDAMIMAGAGLSRIGLQHEISQWVDIENFLPAAGQGAIAVEAPRDTEFAEVWRALDDPGVRVCVEAEREFVHALGADCRSAAGALATIDHGEVLLRGMVCSADGQQHLPVALHCSVCASDDTALRAAELLLQRGAAEILKG